MLVHIKCACMKIKIKHTQFGQVIILDNTQKKIISNQQTKIRPKSADQNRLQVFRNDRVYKDDGIKILNN